MRRASEWLRSRGGFHDIPLLAQMEALAGKDYLVREGDVMHFRFNV